MGVPLGGLIPASEARPPSRCQRSRFGGASVASGQWVLRERSGRFSSPIRSPGETTAGYAGVLRS
jgi:hypothetical protein